MQASILNLQVRIYPNAPVSLSEPLVLEAALAQSVRLLNGPVKRWHEVNHLQPPVDSERRLVMMPSVLHLVGHM